MIIFYHLGWPRRVMNYRVNDVMFHSVLNRSTKMFYSMKRIQIIGDHTYSINNYQKTSMENANDWLNFRTWDDLEQSCQIVFSLWCYILFWIGQLKCLIQWNEFKSSETTLIWFCHMHKTIKPCWNQMILCRHEQRLEEQRIRVMWPTTPTERTRQSSPSELRRAENARAWELSHLRHHDYIYTCPCITCTNNWEKKHRSTNIMGTRHLSKQGES